MPRVAERALTEQLAAMPAVVLSGARQTGKSTLARELIRPTRTYRSLDDLDVRELARREPRALTGAPGKLTLDEVQREPQLLLAVKQEIDRERRQLQERVSSLLLQVDQLEHRNPELNNQTKQQWFLIGGGVLGGGILLGLILPNLRLRRRRSSGGGSSLL